MVRSKSNRKVPKHLDDQKGLTTGFEGAEDLPTMKPSAIKVSTAITSSAVAKAGSSGPTFDKDESFSEHPNVVETIPHNYDTNPVEMNNSGSSLPMLLFLACGAGCVAWMYASQQKKQEAKDKMGAFMQMFGPLVQDAMAAIGEVVKTAGQAQTRARHVAGSASFPARAAESLFKPSGYQKVVGSEDDDELVNDQPEEYDPYANAAAGMEEHLLEDQQEDVPNLVEQAPPLDLFADNVGPPLDLLADSEPQTLDSLGLVDTEKNSLDLGF